jgi:hypothetical protein
MLFLPGNYFVPVAAVAAAESVAIGLVESAGAVVVTAALTAVVSAAGVASVAAGLLLQAVKTTPAVTTKAKNTFFISLVFVLG